MQPKQWYQTSDIQVQPDGRRIMERHDGTTPEYVIIYPPPNYVSESLFIARANPSSHFRSILFSIGLSGRPSMMRSTTTKPRTRGREGRCNRGRQEPPVPRTTLLMEHSPMPVLAETPLRNMWLLHHSVSIRTIPHPCCPPPRQSCAPPSRPRCPRHQCFAPAGRRFAPAPQRYASVDRP